MEVPLSHLHPEEAEASMLLPQYEIFHNIGKYLPELEHYVRMIHNGNPAPTLSPQTEHILQQGIFDQAKFLTSYHFDTANEYEAVEIWEQTKIIRNLSLSLLMGQVYDHLVNEAEIPIQHTAVFGYTHIHEILSTLPLDTSEYVNPLYMTNVRTLMDALQLALNTSVDDVICTLDQLDPGHPLHHTLQNLYMLIGFADRWHLTRKTENIETLQAFIKRGIVSMTTVPYQMIGTITSLSEKPTREIVIGEIYSASFNILGTFANGDREIRGQQRRLMEDMNTEFFHIDEFEIVPSAHILIPRKEAFTRREEETRRNVVQQMKKGEIWERGHIRQVTGCPAFVSRGPAKPKVIKSVFGITIELLEHLNRRYAEIQ